MVKNTIKELFEQIPFNESIFINKKFAERWNYNKNNARRRIKADQINPFELEWLTDLFIERDLIKQSKTA